MILQDSFVIDAFPELRFSNVVCAMIFVKSRPLMFSRHDIFCHCSCFVLMPSRRSFADWFGVHGLVLSLFLRVVPLLIGSTCII